MILWGDIGFKVLLLYDHCNCDFIPISTFVLSSIVWGLSEDQDGRRLGVSLGLFYRGCSLLQMFFSPPPQEIYVYLFA